MVPIASGSGWIPALVCRLRAAVASRLVWVALALLVTGKASAQGLASLPESLRREWTEVAGAWRTRLDTTGIIGGSLALVRSGEVLFHETNGMADLASGRPVDEETIFHWASITKTFTGIAVMQLRDRGLLELDDPVVDWVPEVRGVYNPFGSMEDVTLRHLLSHSAGFQSPTFPWAGTEDWQPHEPTDWGQLVAMIPYTRLHFAAGSRYQYSNPGIVYLGRVIEAITGDVFEAHIEKNIFRPLGMTTAYFDVTPWHLLERRSNHYFVEDGEVRAGGLDFNTGITVSNGGLNASFHDMARYLGFLAGAVAPGSLAEGVLDPESLEEMWTPVVAVGSSNIGAESMGLTFFVYDGGKGDRRIIGHTGSQRAYYSFIYLDPETGVGTIAAFNTVGISEEPNTRRVLNETRADVLGRVFPLFR